MSPHSTHSARPGASLPSRLGGRHPHARYVLAAVVAGMVGLGIVIPTDRTAAAQRAQDRQRAMFVTVTDQADAPVSGLTPDDFIIREDGVRREVLRVEPATSPMEITVVVDTSEASSPFIADMRRALTDFVDEMTRGNEIAITAFGGRPQVVQNYTNSGALLVKAVNRLFPEQGSGAYLLEALSSVARGITKRTPERPVIVAVLVQGAPEFSELPYERVVMAIRESGALFNAIALQQSGASATPARGEQATAVHDRDVTLDLGTRATGGVNRQALSSMSLGPELKTMAAQLRGQYRVTYARPESLIPPEKIEVSTRKAGLTARGTPVKAQDTR